MQIVFDFIAGDIPFDEFWEAYCANPKIGEWLDSIADFSHEPPPVIAKDRLLYALYRTIALVYDGHVLRMLAESPYPPKDSYTTIVRRQCGIYNLMLATVYKGNIIKNLIMDCQSYTKYRPNETTGGIFVSWRRKEELPTGA